MTGCNGIRLLVAAATVAACADRSPNPVAPAALGVQRVGANACPGLGDGCIPVTDVIDVTSVDAGDAYITSGDGTRYYVSWATQFLPVALPPGAGRGGTVPNPRRPGWRGGTGDVPV